MRLSKEDRATVFGIIAFLMIGLISYFVFKLGWYPTLIFSAIIACIIGLVYYKR